MNFVMQVISTEQRLKELKQNAKMSAKKLKQIMVDGKRN